MNPHSLKLLKKRRTATAKEAITNTSDRKNSSCSEGWAYPFPRSKMPKELSFAMDQLSKDKYDSLAPSNRNTDMEYIKGKTFTCILDGFIISDNVQMTDYTIKDNVFKYSDHQPVFMSFKLK